MTELTLSIIAPCYGEQDNIAPLGARVLATLDRLGVSGELVLVDDGSRDLTWARMQQLAAAESRVVTVRHPANRGMEAAWRSGLGAARGRLICLIDADLQNRPEDIEKLYRRHCAAPQVDIVQAVRRPARGVRRLYLFSRVLNGLLNAAFGTKLGDSKSGFVVCDREVLAAVLHHRYRYRYFQSFIGVSAGARGYRVGELPTRFEERRTGQSFLSRLPLLVSLRIVWELGKFRVETWLE